MPTRTPCRARCRTGTVPFRTPRRALRARRGRRPPRPSDPRVRGSVARVFEVAAAQRGVRGIEVGHGVLGEHAHGDFERLGVFVRAGLHLLRCEVDLFEGSASGARCGAGAGFRRCRCRRAPRNARCSRSGGGRGILRAAGTHTARGSAFSDASRGRRAPGRCG